MKRMCHSLGTKGREEIGRCQREERQSCTVAGSMAHSGFSEAWNRPGPLTGPHSGVGGCRPGQGQLPAAATWQLSL